MVQFIKLALLSAVLAVTAFGLENGSGFRNGISHSPLKLPEHLATTFSRGGKHDFKTPSSSPTFISNSPNLNTNSNIAKPESSGISSSLWNDNTKIPIFMTVWFAGNMFYNEWNKKACTALGKSADGMSNLHWTLSAVQLLVGVLFVVPMWLTGLRQAPQMSFDNWKELAPVGFCTCLSHAFSVLSMAVGAVSFGQIVKSAEPVFAAATNAAILKDFDHPYVYAALLPIIGGVSLASLKELSFSTTALLAASAANQAAAFKNVVSKGVMKKSWAKQLGPQNLFAAVTILAFLSTVPFALYFEWNQILPVYEQLVKTGKLEVAVKNAVLSGLAFYIYNEAAFLALDKLSPVTHSVANTVKRVAVIVYTCFVFNTPMSTMGAVGSGIAVAGTLLYSLVKQKFSKHAAHGHGHGSAATSASQVPPASVNGKK